MIRWSRSEDGYCESKDGRFKIRPLYYGRCSAQSYEVRDVTVPGKYTGDTQRACKTWALTRLIDESRVSDSVEALRRAGIPAPAGVVLRRVRCTFAGLEWWVQVDDGSWLWWDNREGARREWKTSVYGPT